MMPPWSPWLWMGALFLGSAGLFFGEQRWARQALWTRGLQIALVLLALYPLAYQLAQAGVTWLYLYGPEPWAQWWMPSRDVLPLTHYLDRLSRGAGLALLLLALITVGLSLGGILRARTARTLPLPSRRALQAIGVLLGLLLALPLSQQLRFLAPHPVFYVGCRKVWGHRGHPQPPEIPENSIDSFRRAFDLGAAGVEMDVAYLPERREFLIHRPDREYARRLTLQEVFQAVGNRGYFWLDIKTIRQLTPEQAQQAAQDLALLVDAFGLRKRVIVESDHPENLALFARQGLHTSYWIFNIDEDAYPPPGLPRWRALWQVRENYIRGGFSAISMDYRMYRPEVARALWGARIHLFTVNDSQRLRDLVNRSQIRVVLTDLPLFDITTCPTDGR